MDNLEEALLSPQSKLVVAETYPIFSKNNIVFILMIKEEMGAAGGRAAGYGSRRISQVIGFKIKDGIQEKLFDIVDSSLIDMFEIPYSATAIDIVLNDGRKIVVSGIIDQELVKSYILNTKTK